MNHPKIKVGMTEIKLGLSLTPAEAGLMRWGLDTEKNYRDIIFKGDLIPITEAVERGIFDEFADSPEELMEKAKAKGSCSDRYSGQTVHCFEKGSPGTPCQHHSQGNR